MKRREFLVGGATAVVGLTCLSRNLRAALAQARLSGKPLLTEGNLNEFIKSNPLSTPKGQQVFAEAGSRLEAFATRHFYLTEEQRRELATISAEDRRKLAGAIEQARKEGKQLKVRIVSGRASLDRQRFSEADHSMPLKTTTIHIGIEIFGKDIGITFSKETKDDPPKGNSNKT
jgi:hypothetical protein